MYATVCATSELVLTLRSPTNFSLLLPRQFLPLLIKIGSPAFRRFVLELLPFEATKTMLRITNIMDATSRRIFKGKKDALAKGDEAVKNQIGQGKDIMSILRELVVSTMFAIGGADVLW